MPLVDTDGNERVEYESMTDEDDESEESSIRKTCANMVRNRDGIPLLLFVLRVLHSIIDNPTAAKNRYLAVNAIRSRCAPYGQVAIDLLIICKFIILKSNQKDILVLKPRSDSGDINKLIAVGNIIVCTAKSILSIGRIIRNTHTSSN